eukprot:402784_1
MSNIKHEGWVKKKSRYIKSWNDRWAVITSTAIYTYKEKQCYENATEIIYFEDIKNIEASQKDMSFTVIKKQKMNAKIEFKTDAYWHDWIRTIHGFINQIKIPVNIECERNNNYSNNFELAIPYYKQYSYKLESKAQSACQGKNIKDFGGESVNDFKC